MNKSILFLALVVLSLSLSACGMFDADKIRANAEANTEAVQAQQYAANQEQQRQIAADEHAVDMAKEAYWQSVWNAALATVQFMANVFVVFVGIVACGVAVSFGYTAHKTTRKVGDSAGRFTWVKANLIYLDHKTGTYPLYLSVNEQGQMLNASVHGALPMNESHEPDRQMVNNNGAVIIAGMIATQAAKSKDPAGVANVTAQSVDIHPAIVKLLSEHRRQE